MSKLILSEENYNTDLDFRFKNEKLYQFQNWITDGYCCIDMNKMDLGILSNIAKLEEWQFNTSIKKYIQKDHLKRILNTKYLVNFSDVSLKNYTLASNDKVDTLIDTYYVDYIKCLDVFYKDNTFYLFYENEAEPMMDIDYDSEMFIGLIKGIDINEYKNVVTIFSTLDIFRKLKRLNEYYKELEELKC